MAGTTQDTKKPRAEQYRRGGRGRKGASLFCWVGTFCFYCQGWPWAVQLGNCHLLAAVISRMKLSSCAFTGSILQLKFVILAHFWFCIKRTKLLVMVKFIPKCSKEGCWNWVIPTLLPPQNYQHAWSQFLSNLFSIVHRYIGMSPVKALHIEPSVLVTKGIGGTFPLELGVNYSAMNRKWQLETFCSLRKWQYPISFN